MEAGGFRLLLGLPLLLLLVLRLLLLLLLPESELAWPVLRGRSDGVRF